MEKNTNFTGRIQQKCPCSIAMLDYQRVYPFLSNPYPFGAPSAPRPRPYCIDPQVFFNARRSVSGSIRRPAGDPWMGHSASVAVPDWDHWK